MNHLTHSETSTRLGLTHRYSWSSQTDAPLALLVHGRSGDVSVMWSFRRALPEHFHIVSVQAPEKDSLGGYSWWDVEHVASQEGASRAATLVREFLDRVLQHYELKPRFLVGLGFSQGAGVLSVILQQQPDLFQGVALLAGFVIPRVDLQSAKTITRSSVFIAHGTEDEVVSLQKSERGAEFLRQQGYAVNFVTDQIGHKVGSRGMRELKTWAQVLSER